MIDSVYKNVQGLLNKNQYGFLTPADFNNFAKLAQLDIFQNYFADYNKQINLENQRRSGTDYAHISQKMAENIETFSETNFLTAYNYLTVFLVKKLTSKFYIPSLVTTGDIAYTIGKILTYTEVLKSGTTTAAATYQLVQTGATFLTDGILPDDIVINTRTDVITRVDRVVNNTTLLLIDDIFPLPGYTYKVISARSPREAEKVTQNKITTLNTSLLTAPSNTFPAYSLEGEFFTLYPVTITDIGMVQAQYYRYPADPKWSYVTLTGGSPSFDQSQSDYQDFEIPIDEEVELVIKICKMAGLEIRESEVVQFANNEENKQNQPKG